jgi:serine/threonine protein kinase
VETLLSRLTTVNFRHHAISCRVGDFIGSGGQGEVYRVTLQAGNRVQTMALKWYYPEWATPRYRGALEMLAAKGPPDRRFLWPIDIATSPDAPGFGYLMAIRPDRYRSCVNLIDGTQEIAFPELVLVCLQLADCFLSLHAKGLCYRDISFGNVFVDAVNGAVLIADNDNVAIEGEAADGIRGTQYFMAPEIVRCEALPSVKTDLYSLAVLLFYLLMVHHPLEGRKLTIGGILGREELADIYGHHPLFIFDPTDESNAPEPEQQRNPLVHWPLYPQMLRDIFVQAFTIGLHQPDARVRESQWRDCMARLVDLIVPCGCGVHVFLEPDARRTGPCWSCSSIGAVNRVASLTFDLDSGPHVVMLHPRRRLFAHHARTELYNYRRPIAEVNQHPLTPDLYGLRNLSSDTWLAWPPDGQEIHVPPGRSIAIVPGTRVSFGMVNGVFQS